MTAGIRPLRSALACALVSAAAWTSASPATAQEGATVRGIVYDSTAMEALSEARVAVLGTNAVGWADRDGVFELEGVPAGTWWVSFYHARLQALGVSPPSRQITLAEGQDVAIELAIPSERTLLMGWCMAEQPGPGFAALAGVVTDSLTGVPMPRAIVRAQPTDRLFGSQTVEVRTDESGYFRMCSVPADRELRVQATFGKSAGRTVVTSVPEGGARIQDLVLLMSAEGTLAGFVKDWATGTPVEGALVSVVGTESRQLTDPEGRFVLDDLPPGRHLVVTEGLGYEERTDSVTIFSQETVDIEVHMAPEALEVEGLVVTARTRFGRTSLAMDAKRADFITRDQIEPLLTRVSHAGELLRYMNVPGLSVRDVYIADELTGAMVPSVCVEIMRRRSPDSGCRPAAVYLNDVHMPYPDQILSDLNPEIIERIEILSPIDAQFQYGTIAGNGAVAIYTR